MFFADCNGQRRLKARCPARRRLQPPEMLPHGGGSATPSTCLGPMQNRISFGVVMGSCVLGRGESPCRVSISLAVGMTERQVAGGTVKSRLARFAYHASRIPHHSHTPPPLITGIAEPTPHPFGLCNHQCTTSVPPVGHQCPTSVPPVYHQWTTSVPSMLQ
jgi:hypothetical protein